MKTYQEFVRTYPCSDEFKKFLKTHERVPTFIDNLTREFHSVHKRVKRESIEKAIHDMTRLFIRGALKLAEERSMSEIRKGMLKLEEARKKDMVKLVEAYDKQGEENAKVTHDKAGNETSWQKIII